MTDLLCKITVIISLFALINTGCKESTAKFEPNFSKAKVNMMADLLVTNKIRSKTVYSNRDSTMNTVLSQLQYIHGQSVEDLLTFYDSISLIDPVREAFLDSVDARIKYLTEQTKLSVPTAPDTLQSSRGPLSKRLK